MVRIKMGCREMQVREDKVERYLKEGYKVINDRGEEIEFHKPMSYDDAVKRIRELEAYNKGLQDSINDAGDQIKKLKAEIKKLKKGSKEPAETESEE